MEISHNFKQLKINTAVSYFQGVINEFVSMRTEPVLKSVRKRDVFVTKNFETRCKRLNLTVKKLLTHIFRHDLSVVIQLWMETRSSYDEKVVNSHLRMKNFFVWRELGTVYLYVIDLNEAIIDMVPKDIEQDIVIWAKECQRFVECSNYPEITHWFNHNNTDENFFLSGVDNKNLLEKLKNSFGDKCIDETIIADRTYTKEEHGLWQSVKLYCSLKI